MDKTWHTEHFFCSQCGQQFGEDGFHERDGKAYCRNDYFDMFAPKCAGCNRAIMENYISALNAQWHADCFVCRVSQFFFEFHFLIDFFKLLQTSTDERNFPKIEGIDLWNESKICNKFQFSCKKKNI